ncbi:MAG: hypothetical protein V3V08_11590 [Nannocystaceae bacterium]
MPIFLPVRRYILRGFAARIFLIAECATNMVYPAEEYPAEEYPAEEYPAERRGTIFGVIQAFSSEA